MILQNTAVYGHEAIRTANREMGKMLPCNTCQNLKNERIGCGLCVRRREEIAADEVIKIISLKRKLSYAEDYPVFIMMNKSCQSSLVAASRANGGYDLH